MKQFVLCLLYWGYAQISTAFPLQDKPGFTVWKRDLTPIAELQFSGLKGAALGQGPRAHFGVPDPTCRRKLPGENCLSMDHFTVDKMIDARKLEANNCKLPCLFYTKYLSGAAERTAGSVLWDVLLMGATEEPRKYQTIWDLHDFKYYPRDDNLNPTPELECIYQDFTKDDWKSNFDSCRRLYFKSMSKAMASQCSGEVFLMTMTNLEEGIDVPENGIWWQFEFPTLINPNRAQDKKITKITYLQVPAIGEIKMKELKDLPDDEKRPPEIMFKGEYWPDSEAPGTLQLAKSQGAKRRDIHQNSSSVTRQDQEEPHKEGSNRVHGFVKRADRLEGQICAHGEDCYPYPYPMKEMYDLYNEVFW